MALLFKPNQQNLSLLLNFPPLTARNVLVGLIFWLHLLLGQQERRGLEKSLGALSKDWGEMSLLSHFLWEAEETSTCSINLAVLLTEPSAPAMGGKAPLAWNHRISNAGKDLYSHVQVSTAPTAASTPFLNTFSDGDSATPLDSLFQSMKFVLKSNPNLPRYSWGHSLSPCHLSPGRRGILQQHVGSHLFSSIPRSNPKSFFLPKFQHGKA